MATPPNNEEYGHDAAFIDEVPEELVCVLCHFVLRDALQIMTCGHRFCSPCFNRMKNHARQMNIDMVCPVDREVVALGQVFPDRGIARSIGNLKIKCANLKEGCGWVGELRDLQKHQDECTYGVTMQLQATTLHDVEIQHDKVLLEEIMTRLQKCEVNLIAKEERLQKYENDMIIKEKDIAQLKFSIEEMRNDAKTRDQDIKLLKMSNLQLANEITSLLEKNDALTEKLKTGNDESKKKEEEVQTKIDVLREDLVKVNLELNDDQTHSTCDTKTISDKLQSYEGEMNNLDQKVKALEEFKVTAVEHLENIENTSFSRSAFFNNDKQDVKIQWVMTNYKQKFTAGNDVRSPLFYTSVDGYCFRLVVDWTGPRKGKMGLYLRLYRDESCTLEQFNHEYTFEVMDKWGNRETRKIDYDGEVTPRDNGLGTSTMITAPFDKYVINDSLFIACIIHM